MLVGYCMLVGYIVCESDILCVSREPVHYVWNLSVPSFAQKLLKTSFLERDYNIHSVLCVGKRRLRLVVAMCFTESLT